MKKFTGDCIKMGRRLIKKEINISQNSLLCRKLIKIQPLWLKKWHQKESLFISKEKTIHYMTSNRNKCLKNGKNIINRRVLMTS